MVHELKTWPDFFKDVLGGKKTFDLRRDDRGYRVGDRVILREYDPVLGCFTSRQVRRKITYILRGDDAPEEFGLCRGFCILQLAHV